MAAKETPKHRSVHGARANPNEPQKPMPDAIRFKGKRHRQPGERGDTPPPQAPADTNKEG